MDGSCHSSSSVQDLCSGEVGGDYSWSVEFIVGDKAREDSQTVVYHESIKRDLKTRPIYECRCDERLKTKTEESTRLTYTGLLGELEHLKIETRLIDEMFASVMGECVI